MKVRNDVMEITGEAKSKQIPWDSSSLTGKFYIKK
jgi:hypothetical protein